jgi:hypothetical protein
MKTGTRLKQKKKKKKCGITTRKWEKQLAADDSSRVAGRQHLVVGYIS